MAIPEFVPFPKIVRLNRELVVTEKLDGTNACVHVTDDGQVLAASRTRWITPESDNYGFAAWVKAHEIELREGLGAGSHFGEWWGSGIQRRYGLTEKRFSLFNVHRWGAARPNCCHVVPELGRGIAGVTLSIGAIVERLREHGSVAAEGFMRPEGIVVFHTASSQLYKMTLENDEAPKGQVAR